MEAISKIIFNLHVVSGFAALTLFWIPVLVKKGSREHRKIGRLYVFAMFAVAISALYLSIENILSNRIPMGLFLGYLSLLTARPLILGIMCLKCKTRLKSSYSKIHILTSTIVAFTGICLLFYGFTTTNSLALVIIAFGIIGSSTTIPDMFRMRSARYSAESKQWLSDHISCMGVAGIAAHTAFLVFGSQSLFPPIQNSFISITLWVSPTIIGLIAIKVAKNKYLKSSKRKTHALAKQS